MMGLPLYVLLINTIDDQKSRIVSGRDSHSVVRDLKKTGPIAGSTRTLT